MERPDAHIIFPSSYSSWYSLWTTLKYNTQQNFNMALQTEYNLTGWESTFIEAGIPATSANIYTQTFSSEEIPRDSLHMLDPNNAQGTGHQDWVTCSPHSNWPKNSWYHLARHMKPPTTKLPQLSSDMTTQQFQKFRIDRDVLTRITNLPTAQTNVQLYNCADEAVPNSIINTYPEFFNTSLNKLLDMLEGLVTRKSNPMVHWISFSLIAQSDNETVQNYVVRLWSGAWDCDFICPNCHHVLSHIYIKDQFIQVIANNVF